MLVKQTADMQEWQWRQLRKQSAKIGAEGTRKKRQDAQEMATTGERHTYEAIIFSAEAMKAKELV